MFDNPQNVAIYNSTLISADRITHKHTHITERDPLAPLKTSVVTGAYFDSSERYDPPKCHPQTRIAVLSNIDSWAKKRQKRHRPILWLRGAAGAGKSAIAQTLCESWSRDGSLAASFYFSRTAAGRNQSRPLIPTIAYQLIQSFPIIRPYIENAFSQDERLLDRPLQQQIMALIVNPLMAPFSDKLPTKVIVIDGLDECCVDYPNQDHEKQQKEILEAISLATQFPIPLRFLIASRPERQIRHSFRSGQLYCTTTYITLDSSQNPEADIELFLRSSFRDIKEAQSDIQADWPSKDVIQQLVTKSSGHFVYAATVVRYISDPRGDPERRLDVILGLQETRDNGDHPFAQLDTLYLHIMASIQPHSLGSVLHIFAVLLNADMFHVSTRFQLLNRDRHGRIGLPAPSPFTNAMNFSINFFSTLLYTTPKQIFADLEDLHSIMDIPSLSHASEEPIRFIHASFGEFLLSQNRSNQYHISLTEAHLKSCISIAQHALQCTVDGPSIIYETRGLAGVLINGLRRPNCTPSKDLGAIVHAITGRRIGGPYIDHLNQMGLHVYKKVYSMRRVISNEEMMVVFTYLQKCNIPSIEDSARRRWVMGVRLAGRKARMRTYILFLKVKDHPVGVYVFFILVIVPAIVIITLACKIGFKQ